MLGCALVALSGGALGSTLDSAAMNAGATAAGSATRVVHEVALLTPGPHRDLFGGGGGAVWAPDTVVASGATVVSGTDGNGWGFGALFVFTRPRKGWRGRLRDTAVLFDSDGQTNWLGGSLAMSGASVFSGNQEGGDNPPAGGIDVFTRPRTGWHGLRGESAILSSDAGLYATYLGCGGLGFNCAGTAVAASRSAVAVLGRTSGPATSPSVYVFTTARHHWTTTRHESADLFAPAGVTLEAGPAAITFSGPSIVAGPGETSSGASQGIYYVFDRPRSGWQGFVDPSATLSTTDGAQLGAVVASAGSAVTILGERVAPAGGRVPGVYVFTRPSTGWHGVVHEVARLSLPRAQPRSSFGASIAIAAARIVVGAPDSGTRGQGAAYVFSRPAGGWHNSVRPTATLMAAKPKPGQHLGRAATISDGIAFIASHAGVFAFTLP